MKRRGLFAGLLALATAPLARATSWRSRNVRPRLVHQHCGDRGRYAVDSEPRDLSEVRAAHVYGPHGWCGHWHEVRPYLDKIDSFSFVAASRHFRKERDRILDECLMGTAWCPGYCDEHEARLRGIRSLSAWSSSSSVTSWTVPR